MENPPVHRDPLACEARKRGIYGPLWFLVVGVKCVDQIHIKRIANKPLGV